MQGLCSRGCPHAVKHTKAAEPDSVIYFVPNLELIAVSESIAEQVQGGHRVSSHGATES